MVQTRHQSKIQNQETDEQPKTGKHKISDNDNQPKQSKKRKTKAEKEHEKHEPTKPETTHKNEENQHEKEHEKHDQHKKEDHKEDQHKEQHHQHHAKDHKEEHKEHHHKDTEKTTEESLLHSSKLHKNMNSDITDILREVAFFQKSKGNSGKGFAYDRAANAIETYPTRIASGDEAKQISGIGDKIAAQIDEILTSGKLKMLEEQKRDHNLKLIEELAEAKGVGPIRARALVEKEGIKSLEDLKKESYELPTTARLGVKYLDDLDKKISREECEKVAEKIEKYVKEIDSNLSITIVGEYRRGEKEITETSLLLINNEGNEDTETMDKLKDILEKEKVIVETVAHGKQRLIFGIHVSDNAPFHWVEIHLVPKEGYYAALLSMTGPTEFVKEMRSIAKSHGYKLSEYGFFQGRKVNTMKRVPIDSEEDIFKTINLEYRPPNQRRFSSIESTK